MCPDEIAGDGVLLIPVRADRLDAVLAGELDGRAAGRGWPHADTAAGLSFAASGGSSWLVVDEAGTVVGELGTKRPPDPDGRVEIGYGLAGPSRGKGLGYRAVETLVDWLLRLPDVRVVEARVGRANEPSVRLLHRLGFARVGHDSGEDLYELRHPPSGGVAG
jgi:ribosomal-protein-alanine N-acetyltransferase